MQLSKSNVSDANVILSKRNLTIPIESKWSKPQYTIPLLHAFYMENATNTQCIMCKEKHSSMYSKRKIGKNTIVY